MRGATVGVLIGLLMSTGCTAPAEEPGEAQDDTAGVHTLSAKLIMSRCAELNFIVPMPMSEARHVEPFTPIPLDPAGATFTLLITGISCQEAEYGALSGAVTGYFGLVPVKELDGAGVPDAAGYLLAMYLGSPAGPLRAAFEDRVEESAIEEVTIEFSSLAGRSHARGTMRVGGDAFIESVMTDEAAAGQGGTLGVYTRSDSQVRTHAAYFSDYMGHADGAAVVEPGPIITPLPVQDPPGPTMATHNYDYGLTFEFDVIAPRGT